jgi:hypothetical protein
MRHHRICARLHKAASRVDAFAYLRQVRLEQKTHPAFQDHVQNVRKFDDSPLLFKGDDSPQLFKGDVRRVVGGARIPRGNNPILAPHHSISQAIVINAE